MRFLILAPLLLLLALPLRAQDATALVSAARAQVGVTLLYDGTYVPLDYPGGDVPAERGVCTDVLIRAFRAAWGIDLQRVVHADMLRDFDAYPDQWGLEGPDRNIDHRRVPNLRTLFARAGAELEPGGTDYRPGDSVCCRLPGNQPDVGMVSDRVGAVSYTHLDVYKRQRWCRPSCGAIRASKPGGAGHP